MDKKGFRVLSKHCFLMGKNTVEAKQWVDKRSGDSAPGESTIIDWYDEFKRVRTNPDDAERSGSPKISRCSQRHNKSPQNSFGRS